MNNTTRQILIVPNLSINAVFCTFYLLPETPYTCSLNNGISETYSIKLQQEYLRNVLEDIQSTMWMDLTLFVSKWCKQLTIQMLRDEFQFRSRKDSRLLSVSFISQRAISSAIANNDLLADRNKQRLFKKRRRQRQRSASTIFDKTIMNDNITPLTEIDWKRTITNLDTNEEIQARSQSSKHLNNPVLLHYVIPKPKNRKYANQEISLHRKPLFQWFARYGFKTVHQPNIAFIVSHDHVFRFEGNMYSNKMYHSKINSICNYCINV